MSERLFHLVEPEVERAWRSSASLEFAPPSLAAQGFVHLSFTHQLGGTLGTHYAERERMVLWEISREPLGDALRLEPSRDDALFPHLYRAVRADEILARWDLARGPRGWTLPEL